MVIVAQNGNVITGSEICIKVEDKGKEGKDFILNAYVGGKPIEIFSHKPEPSSQEPENQRVVSLPEFLHQTLVNMMKAKTEVIDIQEIIDQFGKAYLKGGVICRFAINNLEGCGLIYAKDYEQAQKALSQDGNITHIEIMQTDSSFSRVGELWKMSGGNEWIYANQT